VDYRRWNQAYATIANTITKTIAYSVIFWYWIQVIANIAKASSKKEYLTEFLDGILSAEGTEVRRENESRSMQAKTD
jgi:hypothetical protein